jgi:hypothetical protein
MFVQDREMIIVSAPRVGKWHELAEAIRRGCILLPVQCFGQEEINTDQACAIGAAIRGGLRRELRNFGPFLNDSRCPVCDEGETKDHYLVATHLNDDHRWTRERIADWLDTL